MAKGWICVSVTRYKRRSKSDTVVVSGPFSRLKDLLESYGIDPAAERRQRGTHRFAKHIDNGGAYTRLFVTRLTKPE